MIKRLFDIIVSGMGLFILSPLFVFIILILRFSGEGEVFFFQERMGYKNRPFDITKFATMLKTAAIIQRGDFTIQNDPRVLPIGRILRKFKINELIQLWDVFRGKMSLVGPRPQIISVHNLYPSEYAVVLDNVKPGVTGIGSLVFRDEERVLTNAKDRDFCYYNQIIPYKSKLELWYASNRSFAIDIKIILLTAWCVFFPESKIIWKIIPQNLHKDIYKFDGAAKSEDFYE